MKLRYVVCMLVPILIGISAYVSRSGDWGFRLWGPSTPVLECPALLEMGERELGEVALTRFTIANLGGTELIIDQVETSCSCTGLERERDGKFERVASLRLRPSETAKLDIRVSVQGSPGNPSMNVVNFRTNDPARPSMSIKVLVSRVNAGVTTVPTSVVFGTSRLGSQSHQEMDVFDSTTPPRSIERVASVNPDRVSVRLVPITDTSSEPARSKLGKRIGRLEVVGRNSVAGSLNTDIEIHLSGAHRAPTLIPVCGRTAGLIDVSPSTLVLPRASQAGPVFFGECLCRSSTGKPISLLVESIPAGLSAKIQPREGGLSQMVRIEWDPHEVQSQSGSPHKVRLQGTVDNQEVTLEVRVICLKKRSP